jgi:3',5'-cyclic AMP phosphodiesterase CpdA
LSYGRGRLNRAQAEEAAAALTRAPTGAAKIVVTHHPFDIPPGVDAQHLVGRAAMAMRVFAGCGVDLLLSGHLHRAHAGDTASRYEIPGFAALVVQAGTATSTRGRGEPNAFNVIRTGTGRIEVDVQAWRPDRSSFAVLRTDVFERVGGAWSRVQPD